ncbi:MAG: hypothetical protein ABSH32_27580 [Bryobacteraceae bacterium]|jgi:hypothetical protein
MRRLALSLLISGILSPLIRPDVVPQQLTVQQVLAQMEVRGQARSALLAHYVCLRRYALTNRRFHKSAELSVRMTYTDPGHKTFEVLSERGVSIIRQRVLRRMLEAEEEASRDGIRENAQITPRNYDFHLAGSEMQQGRPAYVLEVNPKTVNKFTIRGRIWVDCEDFAIVRVDAAPALAPSAWIHNIHVVQQYAKVGPVWLPLYNHSMSDSFFFGHTDVAIDSSDYQITEKR